MNYDNYNNWFDSRYGIAVISNNCIKSNDLGISTSGGLPIICNNNVTSGGSTGMTLGFDFGVATNASAYGNIIFNSQVGIEIWAGTPTVENNLVLDNVKGVKVGRGPRLASPLQRL